MSDTTMPATEAAVATHDDERASYECAFHVLPTVAEGEVAEVFSDLKKLITDAGGDTTSEEAPKRFDLAYEIVKHLEGKNRTFKSAYFGWVRFTLIPEALEELTAHIEADSRLLRYLIVRLTRVEEEHPFYFHEALETTKVETVEDEPAQKDTSAEQETATEDTKEEKEAVDDEALNEALKKEEA